MRVIGLRGMVLLCPALLSVAVSARVATAHRAHRLVRAHEAIIGGVPAQDGTFPSLAYIVDFKGRVGYQCTGTVVAPSLVLTAAHCVENIKTGVVYKPSGFRVITGAINPSMPGATVSKALGVIVYPRLRRKLDDGDAALLVLSKPTTAPPITLASNFGRLGAGASATIAGWGKTSFAQRLSTEELQTATTVVQGRRWCKHNAPPFYVKGEICTISPPTYATGGCQGDSGGPLLVPGPNPGELTQIGIAVHVYGRCSTHRPTVYTSIKAISPWVRTWINAYKPS